MAHRSLLDGLLYFRITLATFMGPFTALAVLCTLYFMAMLAIICVFRIVFLLRHDLLATLVRMSLVPIRIVRAMAVLIYRLISI